MGIQKKRLHHIMNPKKGGNEMIPKHIRVSKEAENSYSFAVGDEIRKSLVAPWKLPILPFSLSKRIYAHRKTISRNPLEKGLSDCLFIFDLEKMRVPDQKTFTNHALNYSDKCIAVGIGSPKTTSRFDHLIPSKKDLNLEAKKWNLMLENLLLGIIRAHKPDKLIFVGKYPYAGLMSVLRRCEPKSGFFWIHVRGEQKIIDERSGKFEKTVGLSHFSQNNEIVQNTIYFDEDPLGEFKQQMKENGITVISKSMHAQYLVLKKDTHDFESMLLRNQTLFVDSKLQPLIQHVPDYLLGNLIFSDSDINETIQSVITYRKSVIRRPIPLSKVETKLDIWLN